jgi:hypothetical protein
MPYDPMNPSPNRRLIVINPQLHPSEDPPEVYMIPSTLESYRTIQEQWGPGEEFLITDKQVCMLIEGSTILADTPDGPVFIRLRKEK